MQTKRHQLLSPVIGTSREVLSFHYGSPSHGRKVYIQAALHADEPPGLLVAHHLREELTKLHKADKLKCEVVLVPVANPIGLSQWVNQSHIGRFELRSAENFNRHYPDVLEAVVVAIDGKLTQDATANVALIRREIQTALRAIKVKTELASLRQCLYSLAADADVVLDLHCDNEALMHLYTGSPLWPKVEPLARYLGAVATLLETESGEYPFDEACSRLWWLLAERFPNHPIPLSCVSVTVELRGECDVTRDNAVADCAGILAYLTQQGFIDGTAPTLPPLLGEATPLAGSDPLESAVSGVLVYLRELGETIAEGDAVAEVIDPLSGVTTTIRAATDGVLYARQSTRFIHAGMRVGKVAGKTPFRTGNLLSAR
jgi:predicted deacylase